MSDIKEATDNVKKLLKVWANKRHAEEMSRNDYIEGVKELADAVERDKKETKYLQKGFSKASEITGYDRHTIKKMVVEERLSFVKKGSKYYFNKEELESNRKLLKAS